MTPVELCLNVLGDLDTVHHEVSDEPVDHGILHDDADQACPGQIALAELRTVQILVDISCHAPHARSEHRQASLPGLMWPLPSPDRARRTQQRRDRLQRILLPRWLDQDLHRPAVVRLIYSDPYPARGRRDPY